MQYLPRICKPLCHVAPDTLMGRRAAGVQDVVGAALVQNVARDAFAHAITHAIADARACAAT